MTEVLEDGERALQSEKRGVPIMCLCPDSADLALKRKVAFVGDTAPIVRIQNFQQPLAESFYSLAY